MTVLGNEYENQILRDYYHENIHVIGRLSDPAPSKFHFINDKGFIFEHDGWLVPFAKTYGDLSALLKSYDFGEKAEFAAIPKPRAEFILKTLVESAELGEYECVWDELCVMMYLPDDAKKAYRMDETALDVLCERDLETVNHYYTYKDDESYAYLKDCILKNPSSVIRNEAGEPLSWALLREDGSLGVMYTLPEARKMGYAYKVARDLIIKTLKKGLTPYVHIRVENEASISLAKRLGMLIWGEVLWFGIEKKIPY